METMFKEVPNKEVSLKDDIDKLFSFFQEEKLSPINDSRNLEELLEVKPEKQGLEFKPETTEKGDISIEDNPLILNAKYIQGRDLEVSEADDSNIENKVYNTLDNLSEEQLMELAEKYPKVYNKLLATEKSILNDLQSIKENPKRAEEILSSVENKIARFKGDLMEAVLKEGLSDSFENILDREQQVDAGEGKKTNIDITCENAKEDIKLGNVEIKEGENLYIESKIGNSSYISSQMKCIEKGQEKEHMIDQATGHHTAGSESGRPYKSVIVVSKDYLEVAEDKRTEFEEKLKEMGTELVILDKSASEIEEKAKDAIGGLN